MSGHPVRDTENVLLTQKGDLDGVCGSDHVTYRNPCDLRRAACVKRSNVTVISQLPCGEF